MPKSKISSKDAELGVALCKALRELPKVRRALTDLPGEYHDCTWLEMQAAQMSDGVGQGSDHYFDLPPEIGRAILDAAEKLIRAKLEQIGVSP